MWQEYFNKFIIEDSESLSIELDISSYDLSRHFVRKIYDSEVKDTLKRIKDEGRQGNRWDLH
jgi:hypothetical protein